MDDETKKLLEENLELTKENSRMLYAIRRSMRISSIMSILYWVFIVGSAFGAYYFIQPYLDDLVGIYGNASDVLDNFRQ